MKIGFIGVGLMGSAMVGRLLRLGHAVTVLGSVSRTRIEAAVRAGAVEAADAASLAQGADVVMICVGTSNQVESRVYGAGGLLAGIRPGTLVIDFGTSQPASSQRIAADLGAKGAGFLDAAMGRTPAHAAEGKLNLMVGGEASEFARARPLLEGLAENIFHVGPVGSGQVLKLINNFYAMTSACAMAEAFVMADRAGLKRQALYEVLAAGPNHSQMMDFIKAWAMDGEVRLAFSIANAAKDIGYYSRMALDFGAESTLSGGTHAALSAARDAGWGAEMVPQMVDFFAERIGE
jgi:2-hydroxy-3-oxopropionate reductase